MEEGADSKLNILNLVSIQIKFSVYNKLLVELEITSTFSIYMGPSVYLCLV